jgi:hypothetical protein
MVYEQLIVAKAPLILENQEDFHKVAWIGDQE